MSSEATVEAPSSLAQDIDLFLMLMLAVGVMADLSLNSGVGLLGAFYLALFIHVGFSLYVGIVSTVRTWTWCLLILAWVGSEFSAFLGYFIPSGQLSFWLASRLSEVPWIGEPLADLAFGAASSDADVRAILLLGVLCLDLLAMNYSAWRQRSLARLIAFVAAAAVAAVLAGLAIAQLVLAPPATQMPPDGLNMLPPWNTLPFVTVLRSVPGKFLGIGLMFAASLAPLVWPWARVERLRGSRLRWPWRLLCLGFAAVWVGLGYLGALPPEAPWLMIGQALTILYFGFFLLPFALVRTIQQSGSGTMNPALET